MGDGYRRPVARAVDEVEVAVVVDIERGERAHLIAGGDAAVQFLGESSEGLRSGRVLVISSGRAGIKIQRGWVVRMGIVWPCAIGLKNDEIGLIVPIGIGHAEAGIFPSRLDEVGFAAEERGGGLRNIRPIEDRNHSAAGGGIDRKQKVEVAVVVDIRIADLAVAGEITREKAGERLLGKHAATVVQIERGLVARSIDTQDIGYAVVVKVGDQCGLNSGEATSSRRIAEVEFPNRA